MFMDYNLTQIKKSNEQSFVKESIKYERLTGSCSNVLLSFIFFSIFSVIVVVHQSRSLKDSSPNLIHREKEIVVGGFS